MQMKKNERINPLKATKYSQNAIEQSLTYRHDVMTLAAATGMYAVENNQVNDNKKHQFVLFQQHKVTARGMWVGVKPSIKKLNLTISMQQEIG